MTLVKTSYNRRSFLKASLLSGGGMMLGFDWFMNTKPTGTLSGLDAANEAVNLTSFIKITDNGDITIFSPNPEFGQNLMTSMPMIVAEELDADWTKVALVNGSLTLYVVSVRSVTSFISNYPTM